MVGDPGIGGSPIQGDRVYRAAMLGEQCVLKKYGSNRQKIEVDAIRALQQLFASTRLVRGNRRGSVVVV